MPGVGVGAGRWKEGRHSLPAHELSDFLAYKLQVWRTNADTYYTGLKTWVLVSRPLDTEIRKSWSWSCLSGSWSWTTESSIQACCYGPHGHGWSFKRLQWIWFGGIEWGRHREFSWVLCNLWPCLTHSRLTVIFAFGEQEETTRTPLYYVDDDYPARPEIQSITSPWIKQSLWLRIVHSGDWCLHLALRMPEKKTKLYEHQWVLALWWL